MPKRRRRELRRLNKRVRALELANERKMARFQRDLLRAVHHVMDRHERDTVAMVARVVKGEGEASDWTPS